MARKCGESERSLIGAYAPPRSIVLVFDDDVCGGAVPEDRLESLTRPVCVGGLYGSGPRESHRGRDDDGQHAGPGPVSSLWWRAKP